jgi:hypothetical protein
MKIPPVAAELFRADRQTDGQTDRQTDRQVSRQTDGQAGKTKLIIDFRNFLNAYISR